MVVSNVDLCGLLEEMWIIEVCKICIVVRVMRESCLVEKFEVFFVGERYFWKIMKYIKEKLYNFEFLKK